MRNINKTIIGSVLVFTLLGCGNETSTSKESSVNSMELPSLSISNESLGQQKVTQAEIDIIKNSIHELSWAYYQETRTTNTKNRRWYVSKPSFPYVFSLMPIVNGQAGWAGVSLDAGNINVNTNTINVADIASKESCSYYDYGLGESFDNCLIQTDVELIKNSTVPIVWWFFQASNDNWYIMTEGYSVAFMFAGNAETGDYDWTHTVDIGVKPTFFVEDGVKKLKFEANNQVLFDLNSPIDESLNFPKVGCSFSDVSVGTEYYPFATALCQANIDVGDASSSYDKFEPTKLATWEEILKVANYSKDYTAMLNQCTQSQYINSKTQCHLDFSQVLGFSHTEVDNITMGETARYVYKLFYGQNLTETQAMDKLYERAIVKTKVNENITRGGMAKIILSVAGVYRLESEKSAKNNSTKQQKVSNPLNLPSLPYGLNPPTQTTPLISIELPSISKDNGVKIVDILDANQEPIYEGFNRDIILPLPSIAKPASIESSDEKTLAEKVVESAKNSIGQKAPYVDSTNTHDLLFVNATLGLPTIHKNTQELVDEYKENGKTKSLAEVNKGDIIIYKAEASSDNLPHIAIISDSVNLYEIGLPNISGIQETPIVEEQVDVIIALENLNLPTIADSGDTEDIHSSSRAYATYISTSGTIPGKITEDDLDLFQIALNENQEIKINFESTLSTDIFIDDSHRGNGYLTTFDALSGKVLRKFTAPKTGLYYIGIQNQGNFTQEYDYKFSVSCGENGESCPNVGDYDSITNPTYLSNNQTLSSQIDYVGDVDYYTFDVTKDTYSGKVHAIDSNGDKMAVIVEDENAKRYSGVTGTWGGYLAKDKKYIVQVRWLTNVDTGTYTIKFSY